jgi:hypothetical protein
LYALHLAKQVYETRVNKHVLQLVECVVGPDASHVDLFHEKKYFITRAAEIQNKQKRV